MGKPGSRKSKEVVYRLKAELLEEFKAPRRWPRAPKGKLFGAYLRGEKGCSAEVEREWAALKAGKFVGEVVARGFADYLAEKLGVREAFDDLFEPAIPAPGAGIWVSPSAVLDAFSYEFRDSDEMYLKNRARDMLDAARIILRSYGHKAASLGDDLGEAACIERGCKLMGMGLDQYASWLLHLSSLPGFERIVMFATHRKERIGVVVVLPLNSAAVKRILAGSCSELEVTRDDLALPARGLFLHAMSNAEDHAGLSDLKRTLAQARAIFYQIAYFTWGLDARFATILAPVASEYFGRVLESQGFVDSGHNLKGTPHRLVVLRPKAALKGRSKSKVMMYKSILFILGLFRDFNRRQWRAEAKLRAASQS